jgi:hypothetical protein
MSDPYASNVVLHLPFNNLTGELGLTLDHSPQLLRPWIPPAGGFVLDGTVYKYGNASGDFNTLIGVEYMTVQIPTIGTADFCIEFWFNKRSGSSYPWQRFLQFGNNNTNGGLWLLANANPAATPFVQTFSGTYNTVAGTATAVSEDAWHHYALVRASNVWTLYIDGASVSSGAQPSYDITQTIINIGGWASITERYNGHLDDLRITVGVPRYTADFTPPSAIEYTELTCAFTVATKTAKAVSSFDTPAPTFRGMGRLGTLLPDYYEGGTGKIVGTVKEKGTPDMPVARRVILHRQRDGRPVRETWSAPDGAYRFDYLEMTELYYAVSFDHTGDYQGVVADKQAPVPM